MMCCMQIHAQIASKNLIVQNKCFRGSLNLHMAKASNENISALMSITKKDRDSVVRALNQVLEINYLNQELKKRPHGKYMHCSALMCSYNVLLTNPVVNYAFEIGAC